MFLGIVVSVYNVIFEENGTYGRWFCCIISMVSVIDYGWFCIKSFGETSRIRWKDLKEAFVSNVDTDGWNIGKYDKGA